MTDHKTPEAPPGNSGTRRVSRSSWRLTLGVVIIAVGAVFFLKNTGWFPADWDFRNWWALLFFIPAIGLFVNARTAYTSAGREWNSRAVRSLSYGLIFVGLAFLFLFRPAWGKVWPVFAIVVGVGIAFGWRRR